MHGLPKLSWDSKDIWQKYDYHSVGVEYEPYLDTDFSDTYYLTDTGRQWDGFKVSGCNHIPIWQESRNEQKVFCELSRYGKLCISSDNALPEELEQRRLSVI